MFFFGWDVHGAHFYTYWECNYHFSRVLNLEFQNVLTAKPKKPESLKKLAIVCRYDLESLYVFRS